MNIYISGLYSGPSPSPGIGVARSLRNAYPEAKLIGVDYWDASPGIHFEEFDEIWLQPSFEQINPESYAQQILKKLNQGDFWISTLDLEVNWLADTIGSHKNLLSLHTKNDEVMQKPEVNAANPLCLNIPDYIKIKEKTNEEIYSFCRKNSWKLWLKSPFYEAISIKNWNEFEQARIYLENKWKTKNLFLQKHVTGHEESIAFSAYQGELLKAVYMKKRITTPDGKTWAGKILELDEDTEIRLRKAIKDVHYTGGGELELVVNSDDKKFLIEWNPRFPAWIHGASLSGKNVVAALVEKASGIKAKVNDTLSTEFTRVVLEIPVKAEYGLPIASEQLAMVRSAGSKYGNSFNSLLENFNSKNCTDQTTEKAESVSPNIVKEDLNFEIDDNTPCRILLPRTAIANFSMLTERLSNVNCRKLKISPAYSVKTSPDKEFINLALKNGYFIECISQLEVKKALELGYKAHDVILNGPGKYWPLNTFEKKLKLKCIFCDSIEELERAIKEENCETLGVRIKIPSIQSRFGINISDPDSFSHLIRLLKEIPSKQKIGIHFHIASSAIGVGCWLDAFESLISWVKSIEKLSHKKITTLDLGGGWLLKDLLELSFQNIATHLESELPHLENLHFEPGKALTQSTMALATKVLDIRKHNNALNEIVVDACIAEMPIANVYPHSFLWRSKGTKEWKRLSRGNQKVLGRICMEDDILSKGLSLPEELKIGDEMLVLEAGAYERSMSYGFGRGGY